jgi:hypothetical protein
MTFRDPCRRWFVRLSMNRAQLVRWLVRLVVGEASERARSRGSCRRHSLMLTSRVDLRARCAPMQSSLRSPRRELQLPSSASIRPNPSVHNPRSSFHRPHARSHHALTRATCFEANHRRRLCRSTRNCQQIPHTSHRPQEACTLARRDSPRCHALSCLLLQSQSSVE